jgi:hypothetical protein
MLGMAGGTCGGDAFETILSGLYIFLAGGDEDGCRAFA